MEFSGYMARPAYDPEAAYVKVKQNGLTLDGVRHEAGAILEIAKINVGRRTVRQWWSTYLVDMLGDAELDELTKPKRK